MTRTKPCNSFKPDTFKLVEATVCLPDTVTYAGAFVLKGRELDRVLASSGYIKGDTAYYFLRDHQGSVRQVVSGADGCVVQENQYYPYGGLHGESSALALASANGASASPYKYGGKEHISFANAHLLDFTARTYDPAILSFHQPDPHQESYYPLSPYLYCAADPVNHIDPTGMDGIVSIKGTEVTISVNIHLYGSGANADVAKTMQDNIIAYWGKNPETKKDWTYTDQQSNITYTELV